jgi:hypothetical protein
LRSYEWDIEKTRTAPYSDNGWCDPRNPRDAEQTTPKVASEVTEEVSKLYQLLHGFTGIGRKKGHH